MSWWPWPAPSRWLRNREAWGWMFVSGTVGVVGFDRNAQGTPYLFLIACTLLVVLVGLLVAEALIRGIAAMTRGARP